MTDDEPADVQPEQAIEQMKDATARLREQAWKVAPVVPSPAAEPATDDRENSAT